MASNMKGLQFNSPAEFLTFQQEQDLPEETSQKSEIDEKDVVLVLNTLAIQPTSEILGDLHEQYRAFKILGSNDLDFMASIPDMFPQNALERQKRKLKQDKQILDVKQQLFDIDQTLGQLKIEIDKTMTEKKAIEVNLHKLVTNHDPIDISLRKALSSYANTGELPREMSKELSSILKRLGYMIEKQITVEFKSLCRASIAEETPTTTFHPKIDFVDKMMLGVKSESRFYACMLHNPKNTESVTSFELSQMILAFDTDPSITEPVSIYDIRNVRHTKNWKVVKIIVCFLSKNIESVCDLIAETTKFSHEKIMAHSRSQSPQSEAMNLAIVLQSIASKFQTHRSTPIQPSN